MLLQLSHHLDRAEHRCWREGRMDPAQGDLPVCPRQLCLAVNEQHGGAMPIAQLARQLEAAGAIFEIDIEQYQLGWRRAGKSKRFGGRHRRARHVMTASTQDEHECRRHQHVVFGYESNHLSQQPELLSSRRTGSRRWGRQSGYLSRAGNPWHGGLTSVGYAPPNIVAIDDWRIFRSMMLEEIQLRKSSARAHTLAKMGSDLTSTKYGGSWHMRRQTGEEVVAQGPVRRRRSPHLAAGRLLPGSC